MKKLLLLTIFTASAMFAAELPVTPYKDAKALIGKGSPVMLEVGSTHCKACVEMGELLHEVKSKNKESKIFFIDIEKDRDGAMEQKVRMIPTQIFFDKDGKEVYRHIGGFTAEKLSETLKKQGIIK
jgi:thioredoxin 1